MTLATSHRDFPPWRAASWLDLRNRFHGTRRGGRLGRMGGLGTLGRRLAMLAIRSRRLFGMRLGDIHRRGVQLCLKLPDDICLLGHFCPVAASCKTCRRQQQGNRHQNHNSPATLMPCHLKEILDHSHLRIMSKNRKYLPLCHHPTLKKQAKN